MDQEMSSRVCEENRPGRDLFLLVRSVVRKCTDLHVHSTSSKLQFCKDDIPIHLSLLNEIKEWKRHWTLEQPQEDPTTLFECYLAADEDRFPNIKALLRICCALPVGRADAERSFSCLRRTALSPFGLPRVFTPSLFMRVSAFDREKMLKL